MRWIDRVKDPIQSDIIKIKLPRLLRNNDPIYNDPEMVKFYGRGQRRHELHKKESKQTIKERSGIGLRNSKRLIFDHYCGSDLPHCIVCGNADKRVLELHHVKGKKAYPSKWRDIVKEGFPEGWIKPLCANCHEIEHNTKYEWKQKVYKK